MRPRAILALAACLLALALHPVAAAEPADPVATARGLLIEAEAALKRAESAEARLAALGRAVTSQERALSALGRLLRALAEEEREIEARIAAEERRLPEMLGALQSLAQAPRSALLVYPDRPAQGARAAAVLGEALPALDARIERLEQRLSRLVEIRDRRAEAGSEVVRVLAALRDSRALSEQAMARRRPSLAQGAEAMTRAARDAAGAADLAALVAALGQSTGRAPRLGFADNARGKLPPPAVGVRLSGFADPHPPGRGRAGWTLSVPVHGQVVAPWDGRVRFAGSLPGYGNVMVLEPESGYLILMSGLGRLDRQVGEVVLAGERLGDMGGPVPGDEEFLHRTAADDDLSGRERLYLEVRENGEPVDPAGWFAQGDM